MQIRTGTSSYAEHFSFIKLSDGSYKILTRMTGGERVVIVKFGSKDDGAKVTQNNYNATANEQWYLEPAENIAELTIYSMPSNIHSWVTVKNNIGATLTVGALSVESGKEISFGTFGNQPKHNGIWYNIESYYADSQDYVGRVSISTNLNFNELKTINNFIANNDGWNIINNCSNFAARLWNTVSSTQINTFPTPSALADQIKKISGYKTNRAFQKAEDKNIGYRNGSSGSFISTGSSGISSSSGS